jgi:hypothetical protein
MQSILYHYNTTGKSIMTARTLLTTMFGRNDFVDRKAEVYKISDMHYVRLYKNDAWLRDVNLDGKSIHFANDVAENWVGGIIEE